MKGTARLRMISSCVHVPMYPKCNPCAMYLFRHVLPVFALLAVVLLVATTTTCSLVLSTAQCSTNQEFLQAIYNPSISLVWVLRDLAFTETDWSPYTSPLLLQRDVNVSGIDDSYIAWPVIDLGFVASKVKLAANITLSFTRVVIKNWRKGPEFQAPGLDLFATNKQMASMEQDDKLPNLKFKNATFIMRNCLRPSIGILATESTRRPAFISGKQSSRTPLPQDGCINNSTAPVMQRCWPMALSFDDVVTYGYNLVGYNPEPAGYLLWLEQTPVKCEAVMNESCMEMYGPIGCFYKLDSANSPPGGGAGRGEGAGDGEGGDHGRVLLAALLGGVLGGVAFVLLMAAATAILVISFKRRNSQRRWRWRRWGEKNSAGAVAAPAGTSLTSEEGLTPRGDVAPKAPSAPSNPERSCPYTLLDGATGSLETPSSAVSSQHHQYHPQPQTGSSRLSMSTAAPITPSTPLKPDVNLRLSLGSGEVELLPGIIGKGTFGRVVPGRYMGQQVAVKFINYGLLVARQQSPQEPHPSDGDDRGKVADCGGAASTAAATTVPLHMEMQSPTLSHSMLAEHDPKVVAAETAVEGPPAEVLLELPMPAFEHLPEMAGAYPGGTLSPSASRPLVQRGNRGGQSLMVSAAPTTATAGGSGVTASPAAVGPSTSRTRSSEVDSIFRRRIVADAGALGTSCDAAFVTQWHSVRSSAEVHHHHDSSNGGGGTGCSTGGNNTGKSSFHCLPPMGEVDDVHGSAGQLTSGPCKRHDIADCDDGGRAATGITSPAEAAGAAPAAVATEEAAKAAAGSAGDLLKDSHYHQFLQEVGVLARIRHPNIVRLLAACTRPPHMCLVMERMEMSLERLMYGNDPGGGIMSLEKILHIGIQIAVGLEYLHPTIIHRDLKPANLLLSNAASLTPVVKLADFGLSRLQTSVLITRNVEVGTVAYMAPEVLNIDNCAVTHRVDIYAWGVILWEMLAGFRPWAGLTLVQIAAAVTFGRQRPPLELLRPERCPPKLKSLIQRCWDEVPERRPAAAEVVKELLLVQLKLRGNDNDSAGETQRQVGFSTLLPST
ncbi:hypothetical protein Vretifemale_6388 [Volvox reticuliferus]|uniref:Protein kinase domain-containing protein n=2 Tax=Volvox reticuliferus TaxID=1737510 RepID=A0A8J4FMG9_9CHLO|nr:hypothetical protein Vretifemale_6388 [Volvox reticuliferus]